MLPHASTRHIILAAPSRRDGWYPEVLQAMAKASPASFAGSPIEAEYCRLSPNPEQFATFVDDVLGLERQDYTVADEALRGIAGKTMIIVGDADGVELEHAIELMDAPIVVEEAVARVGTHPVISIGGARCLAQHVHAETGKCSVWVSPVRE